MKTTLLFRTDRLHKEVFALDFNNGMIYESISGHIIKKYTLDPAEVCRSSYAAAKVDYEPLLNLIKEQNKGTDFEVKRSMTFSDLTRYQTK